ncbi:MAG TPA: PQQ-binding-like beta-propeller repeat protein [bacterium]|nr:PQQ-binding-like beta-propeller repeat protein [bacterium]
MSGSFKRSKKSNLKWLAVAVAALTALYFFNSRIHSAAYNQLLDGDTDKALHTLKFVAAWEPNFNLHRGYRGKGLLEKSFSETGGLIRAGRLAWTVKTGKPVSGSAAVSDGSVFIGGNDGHLYKIDARAGKVLWKYEAGKDIETTPVFFKELVFVNSHGGLHAVRIEDGKRVWFHPTSWNDSFPAISGGNVVTGEQKGVITALDAVTGRVEWRFESGAEMQSGFAVYKDLLFFGNSAGVMFALRARDGKLIWTHRLGTDMEGAPLVSGEAVFAGCKNGFFAALSVTDGREIWLRKLDGPVEGRPAEYEGKVIVGIYERRGSLVALDARTGALIWRTTGTGPIESSPMVSDGVIYVGSHYGWLLALNARTGRLMWRFLTGWDIDKSIPLAAEGKVVVGSMDGRIYALNTDVGKERKK